jgi:hypothetical protein
MEWWWLVVGDVSCGRGVDNMKVYRLGTPKGGDDKISVGYVKFR